MPDTTELRSLLHHIQVKEQHENKLRELISNLENQGKKIRNAYLPIPKREANYLGASIGIGFSASILLFVYFIFYLIASIVLSIVHIILIIPGWLFGFSSSAGVNRIMYILTQPAVWLTRLILWLTSFWAWSIRPLEYFRDVISWIGPDYALDWDFIALVFGISLITSVMLILFLFVLDMFLIPFRSKAEKQYNASIIGQNEGIEKAKIKALEEWTSSTEYKGITAEISRAKSRIERSEQDINSNWVVHSSLKDEDTIIRLINILETGRATDISSAINKMDEDKHKERLEYMQMEANYRAEEEARLRADEARSAQRRTEAILNQIADSSARTEATANAIFWMGVIDLLDD